MIKCGRPERRGRFRAGGPAAEDGRGTQIRTVDLYGVNVSL